MKKRRRKKTAPHRECTYKDFLLLIGYSDKAAREDLLERLHKQPRPDKLCGKDVPKDLNSISYGTLDDLKDAASEKDPAFACAKVLMDVRYADMLNEDVNAVFGFANFITGELLRINELFKSIKVHYSKEEIAAGVRDLDFGSFGILDWYARRMGITNQNEVRSVAWVRIFQCMRNDCLRSDYERKLSEQYRPKSKK